MKVWLDILTPKQANFLGQLHQRLISKGFKTVLTTREYREVNELLDLKGLKAFQVGRHGGGELKDKLLESSKRLSALAMVIEEQKPDVAISFSSPEAARVAFGLQIPHYCVSDSPHAEAVCKLTIPLSRKLFTPWIIPAYTWTKYGIALRDIVRYKALDPMAWLPPQNRNMNIPESIHLDPRKPVILVRTPEEFAAYLTHRVSNLTNGASDIIEKILDINENSQIIILPRYDVQRERFRKRFESRAIVPEHVIDVIPLLRAASVFVGGGGTMTAEAAMLGVPVISYYPGDPTFVERYLMNYGLVERILDPTRIAHRALTISKSKELHQFHRKKSARLMESMEDPLQVIVQKIFTH